MSRWTELTDDVRIAEIDRGAGEVAGWTIEHRRADGSWCAGFVSREPRETSKGPRGWDTSTGSLAGGDLTLSSSIHSQSIACHTHPAEMHGFVRNGSWVAA
jgi:hypothetical protein